MHAFVCHKIRHLIYIKTPNLHSPSLGLIWSLPSERCTLVSRAMSRMAQLLGNTKPPIFTTMSNSGLAIVSSSQNGVYYPLHRSTWKFINLSPWLRLLHITHFPQITPNQVKIGLLQSKWVLSHSCSIPNSSLPLVTGIFPTKLELMVFLQTRILSKNEKGPHFLKAADLSDSVAFAMRAKARIWQVNTPVFKRTY